METNNQPIDATELLVKYIAGEVTAEEKLQVEQWINAAAKNRRQYEHFKSIWDESKGLVDTTTVDEDKAWTRFKSRVENENAATVTPLNNYNWLKIAAALIIGFCAILFIKQLLSNKDDSRFATAVTKPNAQTPVSKTEDPLTVLSAPKVKADTLPDGSIITQNKNSTLSYTADFNGKTRSVKLSGEAFFNVKHDAKKPFVINVNDIKITVLGTTFNVNNSGKTTEVIVETGMVGVQRNNNTVTLHPGEKLTASPAFAGFKIDPVFDTNYRNYFDVKAQLPVKGPVNNSLMKTVHDSVKVAPQRDSVRRGP